MMLAGISYHTRGCGTARRARFAAGMEGAVGSARGQAPQHSSLPRIAASYTTAQGLLSSFLPAGN